MGCGALPSVDGHRVVDPDTPLNAAVIVAVPAAFAVDSPPPVWPLLMVTRFAADVPQCVKVVVPVTSPEVALTVTVPAVSVVALPVLSMGATLESVDPPSCRDQRLSRSVIENSGRHKGLADSRGHDV